VSTVTVITHGVAGWLMLAALFLGSALGIVLIARHHSRPTPNLSVSLNTG
jgi:hypothetical protein